ncbi:MAG TPA: trypsin-like peptidase domain-containing protein [Gemmatales bacterium]|nr:trypsin-like peptidase domain-containing protein [Gemmatales bacterium]
MSRFAWLLLLVLPLAALPTTATLPVVRQESPKPLQTWNPDSLSWSTVLIWAERPTGITLTSGFLLNKTKRRVIAARHALEDPSTGLIPRFYVVWPSADQEGNVISTSDHYFQEMRKKKLPAAKLIAQDASRDLVLLEAGSEPPAQSEPLSLHLGAIESNTKVIGMAQPFTRGGLWYPFSAMVTASVARSLSYSKTSQPVALYVAQSDHPVEFGYSGSPLVLPHSGKLVGMLLAAQLNQPSSFALISSQEIHRFLAIE